MRNEKRKYNNNSKKKVIKQKRERERESKYKTRQKGREVEIKERKETTKNNATTINRSEEREHIETQKTPRETHNIYNKHN